MSSTFRVQRKSSAPADDGARSDMPLGIGDFRYADLFVPERLRELYDVFCDDLRVKAPDTWKTYDAYRTGHATMGPEETSGAILAVAPHVSAFVARLFGVERDAAQLAA